ncbi:alpha/beta fold hydrolase [Streptomyces specialis]|uniref:alpha/beta fold hydrolase n=1 Tax=Streptomyces specialis TaxID=498367 RepID=UPI00099EA327|nr:alpha/beta hydrolase [Streptomyces specialis]
MPPDEMIERRVTVQGISTLYFEAGEGPVILLIHGNATTPRDWWRIMRELSATHRVVAPALPGYGDTGPLGNVRPARLVAFLTAFLDELGVDRVIAVGHSFGGLLAGEFTLTHPGRVTRLVLADSAGLGRAVSPVLIAQSLLPPPVATALVKALTLPGADVARVLGLATQFRQPWRVPLFVWVSQLRLSHAPTFLRTSFTVIRVGVGLLGQRFVLTGRLDEIRVPTLLIWGLTDSEFPVWQAWSAAQRLPLGRVVVIPGAGHPSYLECHEEFVDALAPFIRDRAAAGPPPPG